VQESLVAEEPQHDSAEDSLLTGRPLPVLQDHLHEVPPCNRDLLLLGQVPSVVPREQQIAGVRDELPHLVTRYFVAVGSVVDLFTVEVTLLITYIPRVQQFLIGRKESERMNVLGGLTAVT